jgi:hypothetical protein
MGITDSTTTTPRIPIFGVASVLTDIIAGLVSSTIAIPLAMAFGMFAFVTLGDDYFAYGAMEGLISAVIAGLVCVLLGSRCAFNTAGVLRDCVAGRLVPGAVRAAAAGLADQVRAASGHGRIPEHGGGAAVPGATRQAGRGVAE